MPTPIIPPHGLPALLYAQDGTPMQWNGSNKWEDNNNDNYIDYVDNSPYVSDPILEGYQLRGRMVLRELVDGSWWRELALVKYHLTLIGTTWTVVGNSPYSGYEDYREGAELDENGDPVIITGEDVNLSVNPPSFFKLNIMSYWLGKGTGPGDSNIGRPLKADTEPGADLRPSQEPPISDWTISTS